MIVENNFIQHIPIMIHIGKKIILSPTGEVKNTEFSIGESSSVILVDDSNGESERMF